MYDTNQQIAYLPDFDPKMDEQKQMLHQHQLQQQHYHNMQSRKMYDGVPRVKKPKQPIDQYDYYVALVWNPLSGKTTIKSSAFLKAVREDILKDKIAEFNKHVEFSNNGNFDYDAAYSGSGNGMMVDNATFKTSDRLSHASNKRKFGYDELNYSEGSRQKTKSFHERDERFAEDRTGYVSFRADNTEEWEKWLYTAFRAVQQTSCRVIAKEWIKAIHPKKQSTHPYNGKNTRTGERGDPASTKPPYWPQDVIHKEPDHINKEARTKLLVHLLMSTPIQEMSILGEPRSDKEITATMLRDSLKQKKHDASNPELKKRFHIVEQIIEVRTQLEAFKEGGLPAETQITAPDYSDYTRNQKPEDDSDDQDAILTPDDASDNFDNDTEILDEPLSARKRPSPRPQRPLSDTESSSRKSSRKGSRSGRSQASTNTSIRESPQGQGGPYDRIHTGAAPHPPLMPQEWRGPHGTVTMALPVQRHDQMIPLPHQRPPSEPTNEVYGGENPWKAPISHDIDMTSSFGEPGVVPSHPISVMPAPGAFMERSYMAVPPHSFGGMHQPQYGVRPQYASDDHDPRSLEMRAQPSEFFLPHSSPAHTGLERGYLSF